MNKREAKKLVYRMASVVLASSGEGDHGCPTDDDWSEADEDRISKAWDELVQWLYERGTED